MEESNPKKQLNAYLSFLSRGWKRISFGDKNIVALCLIMIVIGLYLITSGSTTPQKKNVITFEPIQLATSTVGEFPDLNLEAKAAIIYDLATKKILYAKNEKQILPIASITKLMSAVVAVENVPILSTVEITPASIKQEGDSGLRVGERWTIRDLLKLSLTMSSNDGIHAVATALGGYIAKSEDKNVAEKTFSEMLNEKARALNLKETAFNNASGLDVSFIESGAYSSASDIAQLMSYILTNHPEILEATTKDNFRIESLDNYQHQVTNTNTVVDQIPGLIGSKTGFTDLAGGNLVIAYDFGPLHPVVITVLGSSREGRFQDMLKLVKLSRTIIESEVTTTGQ